MLKAIFFDNDGVLVDTERLYFQANREVLAQYDVELTPALFCRYFLTQSFGVSRLLDAPEDVIAEIRAARDRRYASLLAGRSCLVPGAGELVPRLQKRYQLALVTSSLKHHLDLIHCNSGLLSHFSFVLASGDYQHPKPHPDPYLQAVKLSGFEANECLVIEDSPRGLASARAAGLECWIVRSELTVGCDFSAAGRVLENLSEVGSILLNGA